MEINHRKEQFSRAYAHAVAAVAGFATSTPVPDNDSVDLVLFQKTEEEADEDEIVCPRLELQLKCTARDIIRQDGLHFPLEVKNYNELRSQKFLVPRILVVHSIPTEIDGWLRHSEEDLLLRHCSYWVSLRGMPPTDNDETVTVLLPLENRFTPQAVSGIMELIRRGGRP